MVKYPVDIFMGESGPAREGSFMCGIAGLFFHTSQSSGESPEVHRMLETILHRGPDAQQTWHSKGVALGHVRLSILDLDPRSNQPMVDADTGRVIVFNGEIYNYLELKTELSAAGAVFATESDTEVILKAYEHWGVDCLNRFNGMWSIAIYDPVGQTLFCARDRFGIKPFVYGMDGEKLVFASESKAFLALGPEWAEPNLPFLRNFILNADFAGYEETFFKRLHNLLPGHYFVVRHGETPNPQRYWDWMPQIRTDKLTDDEVLKAFKALLEDSIRVRFRSDVPVGACLSGGLDSSSIVGLSTRLFGRPVSTFSCVYQEWPHLDESEYIGETTAKFNCDAHFTTPQFDDFLQAMRQSVWEQDGPTGGPTVLSQRAVMALAKGKVTVLLDGQGGDEVLGGYHGYFLPLQFSLMRRLLQQPSLSNLSAYLQSRNAVLKRVGKGFVPRVGKAFKQALRPVRYQRKRHGRSVLDSMPAERMDDLNVRMLEDLMLTMCNLLHYEDRNSMAFSLESRLPFLDYRLVEFMFSLPPQFKIRGAKTKFLLNETVKDLLPPSVVQRKDKMGFSTPGQQWYRQSSEAMAAFDALLSKPPIVLADLEPDFTEKLQNDWQQCKTGASIRTQDEKAIWRYITACLWLEQLEQPLPVCGKAVSFAK